MHFPVETVTYCLYELNWLYIEKFCVCNSWHNLNITWKSTTNHLPLTYLPSPLPSTEGMTTSEQQQQQEH